MTIGLLIVGVVGVLMFMLSWMATGLLNDGAKWLARTLVRGRVERLPDNLRADYTEMFLAEVEAMEAATALLFAVLLYSPWSLGKELKPLAPARPATDLSSAPPDDRDARRAQLVADWFEGSYTTHLAHRRHAEHALQMMNEITAATEGEWQKEYLETLRKYFEQKKDRLGRES